MRTHLSARLAWHDNGWNGRICLKPKENVSCMVHEHIRENRNDELEEKYAGKNINELSLSDCPPCSRDPGAFSALGFNIMHNDPLEWRKLPGTKEEIDPFSFCTSPYGRMFRDGSDEWESDPSIQIKRLNKFWSQLIEKKSLVFFYVNHGNPLEEEKSDRIIVGIGRISKIGSQLYFGNKPGYEEDYPLWSRKIIHNFPEEGIRLPYQEYLKEGLETSNIICTVPESSRSSFSYVSEHVSDDVAVGIIERVIQSVKNIKNEGKLKEPYGFTWDYRLQWLNKVLEEVWKERGVFPGLGSVLDYLGFGQGSIYQKLVLSDLEKKGINIQNKVFSTLDGNNKPEQEYKKNFDLAENNWKDLSLDRKQLLKILSQLEITLDQVERISNPTLRKEAFIDATEKEIIKNPYIVSELDDGSKDSERIYFDIIDRGIVLEDGFINSDNGALKIDKKDKRRIKSLFFEILRKASDEGDSFLQIDVAIKKINENLPENKKCNIDLDIVLKNKSFFEDRIIFYPSKNPSIVFLKSIKEFENKIKLILIDLLERKYKDISKKLWHEVLNDELKDISMQDQKLEEQARSEKIKALNILSSKGFTVLSGRAGTGKTTTLKLLISGLEQIEGKQPILLLAPTGKARVRLQEITGVDAKTIHQFLMELDWIKADTYSIKNIGKKYTAAPTVIIDECSMIPTDLLGTLFKALDFNCVKRLILVGDKNQLPPIGVGRPFVDIIGWLKSSKHEKNLVMLNQRVRHRDINSQALKLADVFLGDKGSPGDDEILSKVAKDKKIGEDLEVKFWKNEDELLVLLDEIINSSILSSKNSDDKDYQKFNKTIEEADFWQILSPTRRYLYGTTEINRIIQRKYKKGLIIRSRRNKYSAKPFGDQQIVYTDKVMQIMNNRRKKKKINEYIFEYGYVANGEVGIVTNTQKGKQRYNDCIDIKFSTQNDYTYRYYRPEIDENIELAYAITVHKSQGSDFKLVIIILPQAVGTMSRELLYTGLTRFKDRVILLIEKDIKPLIEYRKSENSEILRRNTNLFLNLGKTDKIEIPYPERLIHRTSTGILVRSKSETIICNILTDLGISYDYEKPLYSKNDSKDFRLPDFTIMYKGNLFYWEHLGMLNNKGYLKDWERKENWYKKNDYYEKLIVTKDDKKGGIDSLEIKNIIKDKIINV